MGSYSHSALLFNKMMVDLLTWCYFPMLTSCPLILFLLIKLWISILYNFSDKLLSLEFSRFKIYYILDYEASFHSSPGWPIPYSMSVVVCSGQPSQGKHHPISTLSNPLRFLYMLTLTLVTL